MWWILRRRHRHQRPTLWLTVNTFSIELTHNQEIEMAQTLHIDQIDNLSIAALDARGNPVTPIFDSAPSWTLTDTAASGAVLTPAADGLSAVLTPPGTAGATVTINLIGAISGTSFSATLDVSFVSGAVASISIVATPATPPGGG